MVRLHYVEVAEPDMEQPSGDLQRLQDALRTQWQLGEVTCDLRSLQGLQKALRQGHWTATVAVHSGNRIIGVWPGFRDVPMASRSTSARPRSPAICAISRAAR